MEKRPLRSGRKLLPYSSRALGVFRGKQETHIFYVSSTKKDAFQVDKSPDGPDFDLLSDNARIIIDGKRTEKIKDCQDFRVTEIGNKYFLAYKLIDKNRSSLYGAESTDLINWQKTGKISTPAETGMLVPNFKYKDQYVLYFGEKSIVVALSPDLKSWKIFNRPISYIAGNKEDKIKIMDITVSEEGIFLVYFQYKRKRKISSNYRLKAALFDRENPSKLLWDIAIWEQKGGKKDNKANPIGVIIQRDKLISYWQFEGEKIFALVIPRLKSAVREKDFTFISPVIKKSQKNPIIEPISHHFWESKAVFNPTAFFDEGEVHIIYRAVGDNDVSTLGYATSKDGIRIDKRYKEPIYVPTQSFEGGKYEANLCKKVIKEYVNSAFVSGPGSGGCEDPRVTKIDGRYYMIYVAFDGWSEPRLALTSISSDDFHNHRWSWKKPVLISKPGEIDKSGTILPEKINGKYVIFHRVFPNILIDFVDSLNFNGNTFLKGEHKIRPRNGYWDSRKVGIGPAPLKTKDGWLVIYNAVDDKDDGRYQIGAMLLDLTDPTRVICRTPASILEPTEDYENCGLKFGVVYPCGAVVIDDTLHVYYGASDTSVAVASTSLSRFLSQLKESHYATLEKTGTKSRHPVVH